MITYLVNYTYEHGEMQYAKIVVKADSVSEAMVRALDGMSTIRRRNIASIESVEAVTFVDA